MDNEATKMDKSGKQLGCRVFGDCDRLFREVMKGLYTGKELMQWEQDREKRMLTYDALRQTVT